MGKPTQYQAKHQQDYFGPVAPQKEIIEVADYNGESELRIKCTQLHGEQYKSEKVKKNILNEWIEFLTNNPFTFKKLHFHCRVTQELLEAICHQKALEYLHIFHGPYKDLSSLARLKALRYLSILSGGNVENIAPVVDLSNLVALKLWYFPKITNYSPLTKLSTLENLEIEGDGNSPRYTTIDSLDFLKKMPQLKRLTLATLKISDKDLSPILSLTNLETLNLDLQKSYESQYCMFKQLPHLKYGLMPQFWEEQ